jgi:hypothetical protein
VKFLAITLIVHAPDPITGLLVRYYRERWAHYGHDPAGAWTGPGDPVPGGRGQRGPRAARRLKGADLLVLGTRGHGGFTEALLGSVSQHCVQHASCPVVIIR